MGAWVGLLWMWHRSLGAPTWRWILGVAVLGLLFLTVYGAGMYRYEVTAGRLKDACFAPLPTTVVLVNDKDVLDAEGHKSSHGHRLHRRIVARVEARRSATRARGTRSAWPT
jgi:hypothetical protein